MNELYEMTSIPREHTYTNHVSHLPVDFFFPAVDAFFLWPLFLPLSPDFVGLCFDPLSPDFVGLCFVLFFFPVPFLLLLFASPFLGDPFPFFFSFFEGDSTDSAGTSSTSAFSGTASGLVSGLLLGLPIFIISSPVSLLTDNINGVSAGGGSSDSATIGVADTSVV